ncbi:SDR family NAD(P)-dependent oxidoreductase [Roseospira visakhapatnamensis]|uniref:NAD(P)-dependent dehydrogenase (Short-subunit alcohol dehydrogenase family) n=1 Tax=Roseospira visakhapatnamensis TaxID=390880 RepID=A0A7W6RCC4_9PROT|nr:SDR family NAD(P)-dependent oxidoreductase [Roseospira visakhapatnamensis]MBB4265546.1 NAD(P)-dependent dehydrogenase (short-subunit alcohol dehydrogenase family) [Roseospira visakhapatnamensis]
MTDVIWIVGAGRGIGRALALAWAEAGATVIASARDADDLNALRDAAAAMTGRVVPVPLDVTDRAATARALAEIEAAEGLPDAVVLNAGTHQSMPAARFDAAVFDRLFAVNVGGVVNGLEAVVPRFVARRRGRVVVVASVAGYVGLPTAAAYSGSKAALIALCESLRPDLAQFGVTVQVVNPGFVRTPLTDRNTFPMPFLMEPEAAAARIVRGMRGTGFEITFPRRFTWLMKALAMLPYPVLFALTRRTIPDEAKPAAVGVGDGPGEGRP